ncbi:MAG: acetate--CoA ligase family protein [Bacteroidales bacterium]|nr:acetate--CoA ligase family protein [Bacteroidales bacterium]MBQ6101143.1 acetate--CoA ligase family protein [Bacteroidales bacterium]MBR0539700.1 acetate--CoA ligase family protein [Bacteroidales bacterium]MBR3426325.1 acetate--CoA ligase family protein [Bacteroidales bacterium]MBR5377677.1 acetate--CoA ligase family protein [Bacteroidales bacterium]
MIAKELLNPRSIVVCGASSDIHKPGGKSLKNLLESPFKGQVYAVNPKETEVQGVKCYAKVDDLPQVDCAILCIAAKFCAQTVDVLAKEKGCKGFIIVSAGFSEESHEGAEIEKHIVDTINSVGGSLIGPNCTGFLNVNYAGCFDTPIPPLDPKGVDFITGSGATAVFIKEYGMSNGLKFNSVWAVGNSAQLGIEDVLEHLDETFDPEKSSHVIMLYMEKIGDPQRLLKHSRSLINKGCHIAAIKSGGSAAGSRAASSHTGALATNDAAVDALFRKAGIVRCHNRQELTTVCGVFMHPELKGKRCAVITHAGGPAVMLTDVLSNGGMEVPSLKDHPASPALLAKLYGGSSVGNPIDFLATGTAEQLGYIIDTVENEYDEIDFSVVIFGSPGLFSNKEVYDLLDEKMKTCKKPIFPVLPSIINVKEEIEDFIAKGRINFPEECVLGNAICKVYNTPKPQPEHVELPQVDVARIRRTIDRCKDGYLEIADYNELLDAAGISRKKSVEVSKKEDALAFAKEVGCSKDVPLVMKVVGPLHKSDVGGVTLGVKDLDTVAKEFDRLIVIPETYAVEMYPMLDGTDVYIGAIKDAKFGHQIFFGLGGIFIEVLKDVQSALAPITADEAKEMLKQLKGYKILQGVRGQEGVNLDLYADQVARVSALVQAAPEIAEMDLNPLLGNPRYVTAVDARIRIEK